VVISTPAILTLPDGDVGVLVVELELLDLELLELVVLEPLEPQATTARLAPTTAASASTNRIVLRARFIYLLSSWSSPRRGSLVTGAEKL
jgi:hypothetical protein